MHSSRMRTAAVATCWVGGCLPQCMLGYHPQGLGLDIPLGLSLDTTLSGLGLDTPQPDPPISPLGLGLDIPPVDRILDTRF